jgi:hypothetical protein
MINFFRKIRKKLADDNKPLKYIRYAIGEIVLVVIGILIALQINNWNEERISKIREKKLVELIYDELAENAKYINDRSKGLQGRLPYAINLLNMTGDKAKSIPLDNLAIYTANIFGFASYNPATVHLDRILNSEEFSLIRHDSLQAMLARYKIIINKSGLIEDGILPHNNRWEFLEYQVFASEYHKTMGKRFNYKSFDQLLDIKYNTDSKEVLSNPRYAALVGNYLLFFHYLLTRYDEIILGIDEIRYFIEKHYDLSEI